LQPESAKIAIIAPSRQTGSLVPFFAPQAEERDFLIGVTMVPTNWPPVPRTRSGSACDRHKSMVADVLDPAGRVTTFDRDRDRPPRLD
jgi:hypothetical protein